MAPLGSNARFHPGPERLAAPIPEVRPYTARVTGESPWRSGSGNSGSFCAELRIPDAQQDVVARASPI
jgi:hypothetical protein